MANRNLSGYAPDLEIRRAADIALEYGLALRLEADGSIEIRGTLGAVAPEPNQRNAAGSSRLPGPESDCKQHQTTATDLRTVQGAVGQSFALQRAIKQCELMTLKEVAYEVGVSHATLWRASRSDLPGFPESIIVRRRVYWRKSDVAALEDALMYFKGRCDFERNRRR